MRGANKRVPEKCARFWSERATIKNQSSYGVNNFALRIVLRFGCDARRRHSAAILHEHRR
jgi:hypothetical protein